MRVLVGIGGLLRGLLQANDLDDTTFGLDCHITLFSPELGTSSQQCNCSIHDKKLHYLHTGWPLGFETGLFGFVRPHPLAAPSAVSSMAALNAAPQLGSLIGLAAVLFNN